MALTHRPLHWAAALVLFGPQGGQLQVQMAGGPTDPIPLSSLGSPDRVQNGRPSRHPGPTPGPHRVSNSGLTSPWGRSSLQGRRRTPSPSQQPIGPGLAAQKSPRPPALHSLWRRLGTPGFAPLGRGDLGLHEVA
ncbi:hypothetical protein NDU88_004234 [Pleurodeles waltl]|uniref:Uncharacterized protein n=1 Tax=Pleurodeles waltl TaxID=8319 RepID=A0AAV7MSX1_PLEWA|nr:hypothetical protein NDU88_004234 [Pleurodeles waltl]